MKEFTGILVDKIDFFRMIGNEVEVCGFPRTEVECRNGMEVMCMLREFIQCANRLERIHFLKSTKPEDWSSTELDQVMDIIGLGELNHGLTDEQKFLTIYSNIVNRRVA